MKLYDKNLSAFAVTRASIDREGFLFKRGEVNRSFQRRWFVLKGNLLFYFERKEDKEPLGVIILENFTIDMCDDEEPHSFKIVFLGEAGREYVMHADSDEQMEAWMRSISSASYEHITMMVAEMQKQLDEITSSASSEGRLVDVGEPAAPSPVAPPRQRRANPFHQSEPPPAGPRLGFRALHEELGRVICYDRTNWWERRAPAVAQLIEL
ncbi:Sesquipedalian-1 [Amphibalanus amphitrite]|uniref:Sesquipedalian-1 n=2 Tax=Amphibalanus amphitrite TaxID=1232801 RepID=A0A6A4W7B0_AMPAM|nr:Sesquipedalian-1 [Amphibalanus amphitrite]